MTQGVIRFANGVTGTISAFVNATTLTVVENNNVLNQKYVIYYGVGLLTAPNALTSLVYPVAIGSTNNLFAVNEKLYTIPSGSYPDANSIVSAVQSLLGSNFGVFLSPLGKLIINNFYWDGYGYSELYSAVHKGTNYANTISNMGMYAVADDHEVTDNYHSIEGKYLATFGTPIEATISTTLANNPKLLLYGMSTLIQTNTLSTNPTLPMPVLDKSIDNALTEFDHIFLHDS